jgi:hypothetical protein
MTEATYNAGRENNYQWLALLALPVLVAMGIVVWYVPNDPTHVGSLRFLADFEILQFAAAAVIAAVGGAYGWFAVWVAAVIRFFGFTYAVNPGLSLTQSGSLGQAAALVSIGHMFGSNARLTELLADHRVRIGWSLLLVALCVICFETKIFVVEISSMPYVFLLLAAFYFGLSPQRLWPAVLIVSGIGLATVYVRGFVTLGHDFNYFWVSTRLSELLNVAGLPPITSFFSSVYVAFVLPSVQALAVLIYVGLLGRGLRQRWLNVAPAAGLDRLAQSLTWLAGLVAMISLATLIWVATLKVTYFRRIPVPGFESDYLDTIQLISTSVYLCVPFASFCLGAIYGKRGVLWMVILFALLVALPDIVVAIVYQGHLQGETRFADAIKVVYGFQGINLGRGLALPVYAMLGMIVSERRGFEDALARAGYR